MTEDERGLLRAMAAEMVRFQNERNDMIVAITAILLDLYRSGFTAGHQTKIDVVTRLQAQLSDLEVKGGMGAQMLQSVIQTLESDLLDAAKILREPAAGHA